MELKGMYDELYGQITEIDVSLDSLTGGKSAGKRKVSNDLIEKYAPEFEGTATGLVAQIAAMEGEQKFAVYLGFVKALRDEFDKAASSYVEGVVDAQPEQEALITLEQGQELMEQRKELREKIKSVVELGASMEGEEWEMPKSRPGGIGPRKKSNLSQFIFTINGEELVDDEGDPIAYKEVATTHGYSKVGDMTKALQDAEVDTTNDSEFEDFTMPDGAVVSGQRIGADEESN